ncbi:unnamed protein product [Gadus morhua 'NCC']
MDAMTMDTLTTSAIPQAKSILLCPKMESCVCDYLSAVFGGIVHCADDPINGLPVGRCDSGRSEEGPTWEGDGGRKCLHPSGLVTACGQRCYSGFVDSQSRPGFTGHLAPGPREGARSLRSLEQSHLSFM